ncbi:MAG: GNAT family N-acetyltransferase [Firmicutes bacterium]|nr:GNAT family N-acetyltransferase [Bacillota bacterium]
MKIVKIDKTTAEKVVPLIAAFRVILRSYKGIQAEPDYEWAKEEVLEFLEKGYPIYAAEQNNELVGYIVCRIEEPCLWVEHIFVCDRYRRQGVASLLFSKAEEIAESMGDDTVYNFVHPNNEGMISFLRSKGYTVLNMLEIRKPYRGERLVTTVHVNEQSFDY